MSHIVAKKYNRDRFFADNPTHLATVSHVKFYEHPALGDETFVVADTGTVVGLTSEWEVPSFDDMYSYYTAEELS